MELNQLVLKAQGGDRAAFEEVCQRFEGLVKRHIFKPHLRALGDEAVSEAWLAVAAAVKSYDSAAGVHFAGYVESRVKFALWNLFKRERRRWQQELPMTEGEDEDGKSCFRLDMVASPADVELEVEMFELRQMLRAAVARLPERQRQALLLTLCGDNRLRQAAFELKVTAQAVHNLRRRALTRLKKELSGIYLSERG